MRRVNVSGRGLRFAAAHFVTSGGECESLHGHNYAVGVQVEGEVTADSWVMDFRELRAMAGKICDRLDHGVLLPTENEHLEIERIEGHYGVTFSGRRYVMPEGDVRPLPIDNCTAERLAEWLAGQLAGQLQSRGGANLSCLTVTVEEAPGQSASFTLSLDSDSPGNE